MGKPRATGKFKAKDGMLKRREPGRVVIAGYDKGVWDTASGLLESFGTVDFAAGYFKWWDGYEVRQDALIEPGVSVAGIEDALGFNGTFNTFAIDETGIPRCSRLRPGASHHPYAEAKHLTLHHPPISARRDAVTSGTPQHPVSNLPPIRFTIEIAA